MAASFWKADANALTRDTTAETVESSFPFTHLAMFLIEKKGVRHVCKAATCGVTKIAFGRCDRHTYSRSLGGLGFDERAVVILVLLFSLGCHWTWPASSRWAPQCAGSVLIRRRPLQWRSHLLNHYNATKRVALSRRIPTTVLTTPVSCRRKLSPPITLRGISTSVN